MSMHDFLPVCGYMIVRKPQVDVFEPESAERCLSWTPRRKVNGIWYAGAGREDWADLVEPYYSRTLPLEIHRYYEPIVKELLDATGFHVTRDLPAARRLLSFCSEQNNFNELIAINIERMVDTLECVYTSRNVLTFMGYDLFFRGGWSLLADGYFLFPDTFKDWAQYINADGLFTSQAPFWRYAAAYEEASARGITEPSYQAAIKQNLDIITVYRVCDRGNSFTPPAVECRSSAAP